MWHYTCILPILFKLLVIKCEELNNNSSSEINNNKDFFDLFPNSSSTKSPQNTSASPLEIQRITQPSAQTQQIERTIIKSEDKTFNNKSLTSAEFKPSPHLETYYEHNKFPVPPAFPEAKHLSQFINFGESPAVRQVHNVQWPQNSFTATTTEQPWAARVKFPAASVPTVKDRPYKFYTSEDSNNGKSYNYPSKLDTGGGYGSVMSKVPVSSWDKYEPDQGYVQKKPIIHKAGQQQFDFQSPVEIHKPEYEEESHGVQEQPHYEQHHEMQQGNPWKKIIKFLTAFIPIGLLISALTPTVITVSAMNGTQSRSRAEDSVNQSTKRLVSSLNYFGKMSSMGCEDRILCELLVSASTSKNAEQHVNNLLNAFTENGKVVERAEDLKKVFDAVKKQDCNSIFCKNIKGNT